MRIRHNIIKLEELQHYNGLEGPKLRPGEEAIISHENTRQMSLPFRPISAHNSTTAQIKLLLVHVC